MADPQEPPKTLLSIREQAKFGKGDIQTISLAADGSYVYHVPEKALLERDRALILATRDAIARQVRERGKAYHPLRDVFDTYQNAATFIEGIEP